MSKLEKYFQQYRKNIVGINECFHSPFGKKRIIYADWIASGRLYRPIEKKLVQLFGPYVANTHTESNVTGTQMTKAYHEALHIIKKHVNAHQEDDVIITAGNGMTTSVNKLQRILGLRLHEKYKQRIFIKPENRPVVFVTHMEHHSNHTSWLETICDVVVVDPDENNRICLKNLTTQLKKYKDRRFKIGAFTACSNVTGIETPYHEMAKIMHEHGGVCFVDFACSAPYVQMNMRPKNPLEHLDAIYFSPHKFLGGPGASGVLIFNKNLYQNKIPDHPGGGTVKWTNPWGEKSYVDEIDQREDGGTPGFLQTIKTALSIKLKEKMTVEKLLLREKELLKEAFLQLSKINEIKILQKDVTERLGVISFYSPTIHYNLMTKLLNDLYGVQVRGGCACAGTYGHYLFNINKSQSKIITSFIEDGNLSKKPGWVRLSIHPTMTNKDLLYITNAIKEICMNIDDLKKYYTYDMKSNEYVCTIPSKEKNIEEWFQL